MKHLAIIVGGKTQGSNMRAIIDACQSGSIAAKVACVVAPSDEAPALALAVSLGVPAWAVEPGPEYGQRLCDTIGEVDLVCLAGFMRLLPAEVLSAYEGRILNIHPALLPKFGGKGMYGMHVHRAVIAAGELESGCTVHKVTEHYDEGPIVLQLRCQVLATDTPESLASKVLDLEHQAYPRAIHSLV